MLLLMVLLLAVILVIGHSKPFLRLVYPMPYQDEVTRIAEGLKLDPLLVTSVMRAESRFDPYAQSSKGATGLMQLMPNTAKWVAGQMNLEYSEEKLVEPEFNISVGCWYLASLMSQYGGKIPVVLAAYNGGRTNVNQWLKDGTWDGQLSDVENIPFPETRDYVKTVLRDYEIYKKIYDS